MTEIIFYGADWCPDCQRAKAFLKENEIDYQFIDVDLDKQATKLVESINKGKRIIPTLVINGKSYTNPDNPTLASILGINEKYRILMFGADWCPDCVRAKAFLRENRVNFQFFDVDEYDWATELVEQINNGKRIIPTFQINGKAYTNPNNQTLRETLQLEILEEKKLYDVAIVGAGAAGLTTAIYAQRDRFETIMLEKRNVGGNTYLTEKIENYPGFVDISGPALMEKMEAQAKTYGAVIRQGIEVRNISKSGNVFSLDTTMGEFIARSVLIATGSAYRRLKVPGEEELIGAGIHFCATCDGPFYKDKEVIVIGGGNSALEEAIFLTRYCKKVKVIHRKETFSASRTYVEKLATIPNIEAYMNKTTIEFIADERGLFKSMKLKDNATGEDEILTADGVFIFIGLIPNTKFLKKNIDLDEQGFVETDASFQTNVEGIFAAGDCRHGAIAQVAAATGEGVVASYGIKNYLK